jgi:hypothetical protein
MDQGMEPSSDAVLFAIQKLKKIGFPPKFENVKARFQAQQAFIQIQTL